MNRAGQATGTLTVAAGRVTRQTTPFSFALGAFNVSGTVDPSTGAFTLSGDVPGAGPFTVGGTLPTAATAGAFTVNAGGQTFSGTLPVPGSSGGGGNNGGGNNGGNVSSSLTISNVAGGAPVTAGVVTPNTSNSSIAAVASNNAISSGVTVAFSRQNSGAALFPIISVQILAARFDSTPIMAGTSFPAQADLPGFGNPVAANVRVIVTEGPGQIRSYAAQGGTVTVTVIRATSVTLTLDNVPLQSLAGDPTAGPGTFTLSGSLTAPLSQVQP